jgi:hypothetical protein
MQIRQLGEKRLIACKQLRISTAQGDRIAAYNALYGAKTWNNVFTASADFALLAGLVRLQIEVI